ncbi:hypothetical protein ACFLTT_00195 [Chloroflexota bacterium]
MQGKGIILLKHSTSIQGECGLLMGFQQGIYDAEYRSRLAQEYAPKDIITKTAIILVKITTGILIILAPLELLISAISGCLMAITFGAFTLILTFVLTPIWIPFFLILLGTSWLWLHAWYLRPILLIPGVLTAFLADIYITLAPEPELDARAMKLSITEEWPMSWYILKPPAVYYENKVSIESEEPD